MTGKVRISVAVCAAVLLVAGTNSPAQGQGDGGESEVRRGFKIAPVPLLEAMPRPANRHETDRFLEAIYE